MSDPARAVSSTPRLLVPPGTVVEEKYRIERFLGQGEMGCVFLAMHIRSRETLALKLVHPVDPSHGPQAFAEFLVAARAAARFRSENVAHVRDMGLLDDGGPFLVMEYLEGQTLEAYLQAQPVLLPIGRAVDLALQAARGLGEAHAVGVIHRDAKPSNWFLARTPDGSVRVKLLDFGAAKIIPRPGGTEDARPPDSAGIGTPPYAAPEQVRSPADVDHRADIWTVGVVLYELLAGAPPFRGDSVRQARDRALMAAPPSLRALRSGIAPDLEAVVLRCLEKRPEARFDEMGDVILALAPFQGGGARSSVRPPPVAPHGQISPSTPPLSVVPAPFVPPPAPVPTFAPADEVRSTASEATALEPPPLDDAPPETVAPVTTPPDAASTEPTAAHRAKTFIAWVRGLPRVPLLAGAGVLGALAGAVFSVAADSTVASEATPALASSASAQAATSTAPAPSAVAAKTELPADTAAVPSPSAPSASALPDSVPKDPEPKAEAPADPEPVPVPPPVLAKAEPPVEAPVAAVPSPAKAERPAPVAAAPDPAPPAPQPPPPPAPAATRTAPPAHAQGAKAQTGAGAAAPVGTVGFGERE